MLRDVSDLRMVCVSSLCGLLRNKEVRGLWISVCRIKVMYTELGGEASGETVKVNGSGL